MPEGSGTSRLFGACPQTQRPFETGRRMLKHFYFNRSGLMRVAHIDDGTEDTVCFGTSGDVFTSLQSYFDGSPSIFSLVALYDSEVYSISYEDLDRLSSGFPDLVLWMRNLLIEQVYAFERRYLFFGKAMPRHATATSSASATGLCATCL